MAKIFSKKALALVLTVAMLMSCMVFSFSADAKIETRYVNDFENADVTTNWAKNLVAGTAHVSGSTTPAGYDDANKAMKLSILGTTYGNDNNYGTGYLLSGFRVFSKSEEAGKATGDFALGEGYWKVALDYSVLNFTNEAGAAVDIYVGFAAAGNFYWDNKLCSTAKFNHSNMKSVAKKVATVTAADVAQGGTVETYVYLDSTTNRAVNIFIRAKDGYQSTIEEASVLIDNVKVYSCTEGMADFPVDVANVATKTYTNNFNAPTDSNWYTLLGNATSSVVSNGPNNTAIFDATTNAMKVNHNTPSAISGFWFRGDGSVSGESATGGFGIPSASYVAVEFDYKVTAFDATGSIDLHIGFGRKDMFYWDTGYDQLWSKFTNNNIKGVSAVAATLTATTDEWVKAAIYYQLPTVDYEYNMHVITKASGDYSGTAEVLVDNFKIHLCDASKFPVISFIYGEETVATASGAPGAPFAMPEIALPEGVDFGGVYADAELTTPAELPESYGNVGGTYYVKGVDYLVNDPWSFEDIAHGTHISAKSNEWQGGARLVRNDKGSRTGSNALEVNNENGALNSDNNTSAARNFFILKNGSGNYAEVEVGKNYLLTYWVMVPTDAPSDFQGNLWVAAIGDPDNFPKATGTQAYQSGNNMANFIFNDETTGYVTVPKDGNWHRVTRFISSAKISAESETPNFTSRDGALLIGLANMQSNSNLNVYLDDVDLICLDDLVPAEYENGEDRDQFLFETEVDGQKTHLHTNTRTGEGAYTSVRLAAKYKAGSAAADTILLGGKEYQLAERGIAIDYADMADQLRYNHSSASMISTKASDFENAWNISDDNEVTFTVRLANISQDQIDMEDSYVYRSIYKIKLDGVYAEYNTTAPMNGVPVQGAVSEAFTFVELYEEVASEGGSWFA